MPPPDEIAASQLAAWPGSTRIVAASPVRSVALPGIATALRHIACGTAGGTAALVCVAGPLLAVVIVVGWVIDDPSADSAGGHGVGRARARDAVTGRFREAILV